MPTPKELEAKLWKSLKSDRVVMLGLSGVGEPHAKPMTALFEEERGPLWLFTSNETELVGELATGARPASMVYASKGHELFATIDGSLTVDNDRAVIDRLWNPFIAAWFEEGKDDPKLALLRFDPDHAQIWENDSSLLAGIRVLLGADPKQHYQDKVAEVRM